MGDNDNSNSIQKNVQVKQVKFIIIYIQIS